MKVYIVKPKDSTLQECFNNLEGISGFYKMMVVPEIAVLGYFDLSPTMQLRKDDRFYTDSKKDISEYCKSIYFKKLYVVMEGDIPKVDLECLISSCKDYIARLAELKNISDEGVSKAAEIIKQLKINIPKKTS